MIAISCNEHSRYAPAYELFRGEKRPCLETPARAENVRRELVARGHEIRSPGIDSANVLTRIHTARYLHLGTPGSLDSRESRGSEVRDAEDEFGSMPGFQRYSGEIDSIRFISADVAIVEVSGTTTLDNGSYDEEVTIVAARQHDSWRISASRVMTFDETLNCHSRLAEPGR